MTGVEDKLSFAIPLSERNRVTVMQHTIQKRSSNRTLGLR
jgi:hypothetical protein